MTPCGDKNCNRDREAPEAARKAIETVANLDAGKLLTAGKVEEIKAAAKKTAEEQVAAAIKIWKAVS